MLNIIVRAFRAEIVEVITLTSEQANAVQQNRAALKDFFESRDEIEFAGTIENDSEIGFGIAVPAGKNVNVQEVEKILEPVKRDLEKFLNHLVEPRNQYKEERVCKEEELNKLAEEVCTKDELKRLRAIIADIKGMVNVL